MMDICEQIIAELKDRFKLDYLQFEYLPDESPIAFLIYISNPLRKQGKTYCLDKKLLKSVADPTSVVDWLCRRIEKDFRPPKK